MDKAGDACGAGRVLVTRAALLAALGEAGVRRAADAADLLLARKLRSREGSAGGAEHLRVRKLVQSWLNHDGDAVALQRKTLATLGLIVGADALGRLTRQAERAEERERAADAALLATATEVLADLRPDPARLFDGRRQGVRDALRRSLGRLFKPHYHASLDDLLRSRARLATAGIDLAAALEPFVRHLPHGPDGDGFDLGFLFALARFANDLGHVVDARQLSAVRAARFARCRFLFAPVFETLDGLSREGASPDPVRAEALYELARHRALAVQISGHSPYNLSRCSAARPLADEGRFDADARHATYYAKALQGLPRPDRVGAVEWAELAAVTASIRLRGLCFARSPRLRPTPQQVERVLDGLRSPETLSKRTSTRLYHLVMLGDAAGARRSCAEVLEGLPRASPGSFPQFMRPVVTVNLRRLGGDVTEAEHRQAVEAIRSDRRIGLLCGHHLLSSGPGDPLLPEG